MHHAGIKLNRYIVKAVIHRSHISAFQSVQLFLPVDDARDHFHFSSSTLLFLLFATKYCIFLNDRHSNVTILFHLLLQSSSLLPKLGLFFSKQLNLHLQSLPG